MKEIWVVSDKEEVITWRGRKWHFSPDKPVKVLEKILWKYPHLKQVKPPKKEKKQEKEKRGGGRKAKA